jgi:hypothetical protein
LFIIDLRPVSLHDHMGPLFIINLSLSLSLHTHPSGPVYLENPNECTLAMELSGHSVSGLYPPRHVGLGVLGSPPKYQSSSQKDMTVLAISWDHCVHSIKVLRDTVRCMDSFNW